MAATRKKRRGASTHRRRTTTAANPRRRRRAVTASARPHRRRRVVTARHQNPVHRRHRRRRNPVSGRILGEGVRLAVAGGVIGFTQPVLRGLVGQWIGSSPIANAGLTFGTGWLLSQAAKLTRFTARFEEPLILAGITLAAGQLISTYVYPYLRLGSGGPANPTMSGPRQYSGGRMRGIGVVTGIPPQIVPPPPPLVAAAASCPAPAMSGLGVRPGMWGR